MSVAVPAGMLPAITNQRHAGLSSSMTFINNCTSVGVGVQWLAPMGLFRFSYAYPLNNYAGNDRFFGDEIERFQFSIGQAF